MVRIHPCFTKDIVMHTPKSIDTTHAKPSPTAPSNMADMAQKGSVLLGGVGGAMAMFPNPDPFGIFQNLGGSIACRHPQ